jgi:hypothetical protein
MACLSINQFLIRFPLVASKPLQKLQINIQVDYICTIGETGFYDNDIILNIVKVNADGDDIYRGFFYFKVSHSRSLFLAIIP